MIVTVLGKYGPYPAAGGATSAYLVESGDTCVALDFGSGALARLQQVRPSVMPDAIVLSHLHNDHICDLLPLSYAPHTPPIYLSEIDCPQLTFVKTLGLDLKYIAEGEEYAIKSLRFTFWKMQHPLQSYAMRITDGKHTLFYSGDTVFTDKIAACARGAHLLLLDCAQKPGTKSPHMTLDEGARLQRETGIKVLATHISPIYRPDEDARLLKIEVAQEMRQYAVGV